MPEAANHQQPETMGVIYRMPTSELHPHPDNPFGVRDDPEMQELVDSVQKFGVLVPAIARPRPDGGFELISGHRRKHASELAGLDFMPVIVLNLNDDEAIIQLVDSNIQRENVLPSERAKAYKMRMEAIKRTAGRQSKSEKENSPKFSANFRSDDELGEKAGVSGDTTVIRRHANVRKCLQYAFQIGLIKSNPADRVEKPRKNKYEATIYNKEELDRLFKVVKGDPLELAVILGAFYGLRRSEIVGLKWDAIDFERKTISIRHTVVQFTIDGKTQMVQKDSTKTKSSCRTLPLVAPFESLLRYLKAEQAINQKVCGDCYCKDYLDYIYVDAMGGLIKPNFITQHFDLLLKKHDMKKIRFHDLRHSCASLLYANGVALKDIQEWLGHSDIGTTSNVYTHLDYSNKVSSANAIMSAYPNTIRVGAIGQ